MNESITRSGVFRFLRIILNIGIWIALAFEGFFIVCFIGSLIGGKDFFGNFIYSQLSGNGYNFIDNSLVETGQANPLAMLLILLMLGAGIVFLWLFREVINSLREGSPFTDANVKRIRVIGYILIGMIYLQQTANYIFAQQLQHAYLDAGVASLIQPAFTLLPSAVILPFSILVLAEVFRYGCMLQQEHDTTV